MYSTRLRKMQSPRPGTRLGEKQQTKQTSKGNYPAQRLSAKSQNMSPIKPVKACRSIIDALLSLMCAREKFRSNHILSLPPRFLHVSTWMFSSKHSFRHGSPRFRCALAPRYTLRKRLLSVMLVCETPVTQVLRNRMSSLQDPRHPELKQSDIQLSV